MSDDDVVDAGEVESEVAASTESEAGSPVSEAEAAGASPETSGYGEVWGAFKQLPQFNGQDDATIAARLYEALQREQAATHALQQYQSIIPVASEYLSNREMFQQWMNSQQGQQPQMAMPQRQEPEQQQTPWWNPPKVDDVYRQYLTRDENGREVIDPNAPLEAKHALAKYQAYRANFAQKFLENPEQTLGPMVERVAMERAESIVQSQIQRMKDEQYVSGLEKENADWLYDKNGNASAEGLLVQKYIQDARQLGINGAQARWDYATHMVERDLLLNNMRMAQQSQMQARQQPAVPPAPSPAETAAQSNMEYLRQQAMRQPSQRPAQTTDSRVPKKPMTFADKLAANLQGAGLVE